MTILLHIMWKSKLVRMNQKLSMNECSHNIYIGSVMDNLVFTYVDIHDLIFFHK